MRPAGANQGGPRSRIFPIPSILSPRPAQQHPPSGISRMAEDDDTYDIGDRTSITTPRRLSYPTTAQLACVRSLLVIDGSEAGRHAELGAHPTVIGRNTDCELPLRDGCVSKRHCQVTEEAGMVWVTDLDSTNGTFLDGVRISGKILWNEGSNLRVGNQTLALEFRSLAEVAKNARLADDLRRAADYVRSLLPPPLVSPLVEVEWCFVPSTVLGGDSFGYYWLDDQRFAFYLVDVCGHGTGPAMHSVSVLNVLRQQLLSNVDYAQPAQVLTRLNEALPMERHGDMFFSIWYGVYFPAERRLAFASAGHPPAVLLRGDGAKNLLTANLFVGMLPDKEFQQDQIRLAPGDRLCVFSDGVFEITARDGSEWSQANLNELLLRRSQDNCLSSASIYRDVVATAQPGGLNDDFSLLIFRFP